MGKIFKKYFEAPASPTILSYVAGMKKIVKKNFFGPQNSVLPSASVMRLQHSKIHKIHEITPPPTNIFSIQKSHNCQQVPNWANIVPLDVYGTVVLVFLPATASLAKYLQNLPSRTHTTLFVLVVLQPTKRQQTNHKLVLWI